MYAFSGNATIMDAGVTSVQAMQSFFRKWVCGMRDHESEPVGKNKNSVIS